MKLITHNLQPKTQKLRFKIVLLLFIVYSLWFVVVPVFAAGQPPPSPPPSGWYLLQDISCIKEGNCQLIDLLRLGRAIASFILRFVGVVALIFFIIGGIMWIVASGNPERIKRGKQILVGSLIGILIVFLAWQIVNLVICAVSKGQIQPSCTIFGNEKWNVFPQ